MLVPPLWTRLGALGYGGLSRSHATSRGLNSGRRVQKPVKPSGALPRMNPKGPCSHMARTLALDGLLSPDAESRAEVLVEYHAPVCAETNYADAAVHGSSLLESVAH